MSEQQKRKYDSTVARIAGNILSGIRPEDSDGDNYSHEELVIFAVRIAREIVEAEEAYRAEVEEDTPRMAERTDPWATVDEDHEGKCWMDDVNKARAADAALLRERDAQIEALKVANASFTAAATVRVEDALDQIASLMAQRDDAQAACHEWSAIVKQCDLDATTLRAELDAAQQEAEATVIAQVLAHWFTQGGEARFGSLSMPCTIGNLKATREPANADELVSQILAALSSPPRPQEPQPAEPKSSETRKPVVNLMEALKKSLDSLNANRTSQEPGGHQP